MKFSLFEDFKQRSFWKRVLLCLKGFFRVPQSLYFMHFDKKRSLSRVQSSSLKQTLSSTKSLSMTCVKMQNFSNIQHWWNNEQRHFTIQVLPCKLHHQHLYIHWDVHLCHFYGLEPIVWCNHCSRKRVFRVIF